MNNLYKYDLLKYLTNVKDDSVKKYNICIFNINNKKPVLTYYLEKQGEVYSFPKVNKFNIKPIGILYFKNEGYIFYYYPYTIKISDDFEAWCLMDDICNKKHYIGKSIDEKVTLFFLNNPFLIFLLNTDNLRIEIPISCFRSKKLHYYNDFKHLEYPAIRHLLFNTYNNYLFNHKFQYNTIGQLI